MTRLEALAARDWHLRLLALQPCRRSFDRLTAYADPREALRHATTADLRWLRVVLSQEPFFDRRVRAGLPREPSGGYIRTFDHYALMQWATHTHFYHDACRRWDFARGR